MIGAEVSVDIEITGEDVLQAHKKRLKKAGELGFAVSQEEVPVDRGTLKESGFQPEWRDNDLVFGYTQPYAKDVEEGSEPEVPDWDSIQEWSRRTFGISDEDWLYVVTRGVWSKIAREGTEPQPYLAPAAERMQMWLDSHGLDL